jgi:DNA invertase Pin-like site-specific DNA recombinase
MNVAIYCRVSTDDQNNESQERLCKEYCYRCNYKVYGIYKDVISGTKDSRPSFNQLMEDMRKFKFDAIMVSKLDRMGRSLQHLIGIVDEISKKGLNFIVVTQNIDTTTSSGKLQFQIMGAFAEFERNLISERTKESRKGKLNWGKRGKDKQKREKRGVLKSVKFTLGDKPS